MAPKRALGLGKSAKQRKKQHLPAAEEVEESSSVTATASPEKRSASPESDPSNQQLTVELDETVDPNDELSQLKGLWKTYNNSSKENELMLNGIIHECDRLLRNEADEDEAIKLTDEFHYVYAMALSELAKFNTATEEDEEVENHVGEYFEAAIERVRLGLEAFKDSDLLKLGEAAIIVNRIPLEYISQMDIESIKKKFPNIGDLISKSLQNIETISSFSGIESEILEFLKSFDDLVDIIANFGHDNLEGLDSEAEEDEEEFEQFQLSKKHPLHDVQPQIPEYNSWWREKLQKLYDESKNDSIGKELASKLGKSYLQEAEGPSQIYTTLKYDDENTETEIDGLGVDESRSIALKLFEKALPLLEKAVVGSDPETLVDLAEAEISLGNLYDVGSEQQEKLYKEAEVKLRKANNITHGKYQDILDNLLGD